MKSYDVKYELGQEVYILLNKKVISTRIEKIQVNDSKPYNVVTVRSHDTIETIEHGGVEIRYLVRIIKERYPDGGFSSTYEWYGQEDISTTKEEVISKILD